MISIDLLPWEVARMRAGSRECASPNLYFLVRNGFIQLIKG